MKSCTKCGNSLDDDAVKCEVCGEVQKTASETRPAENAAVYQPQQYQQPPYTQQNSYYYSQNNSQPYNTGIYKRTNSSCLIGFILALVSVFIPFANIITGIVGLVFSILGVKNFNEETECNRGLGIAGIIINSLILLFMLLVITLLIVFAVVGYRYY